METLIGKRISHYHILEQLGAGGMGVVYRAHDAQLDRDVAFKLLPDESVGSEAARSRLLKEARTASALTHPFICRVYEAGQADDHVYIAMELLDGRALSEAIPPGGLPLETILRIGTQIAEALAHAHGKGIIHRDLKANNVIVTPEGRAVVLDFGLAKRELMEKEGSTELLGITPTATGVVMGTPAYLSPEVLQEGRATTQSDIWSLGVVLYDMASGMLPFHGRSIAELCSAILKDPPAPLPERVHPGLRAIIQRCLAKEPSQRYKLASEVQAALQALQPGSGPAGRHDHPNWRRLAAYAAGVAGTVVMVILATDVSRWREQIGGGSSGAHIRSLAVLPLANLSGDPRQEYFADGMTDELITSLTRIGALRVISRTSVMRLKGTRKTLPEISRTLHVDAVVEGSVLRAGDRVRITVQLIEAATDRHLWAESYERELRDILALQGEVARSIANEIRVRVTPAEALRLGSSVRVKPEAYEAYLRGRVSWSQQSGQGWRKSVEHFRRAIELDPSYAPSHAGLAMTYMMLGSRRILPLEEMHPKAKAEALKALELDETVAEAHIALAFVQINFEWNWLAAERHLRRALELDPGSAMAHLAYGVYQTRLGRPELGVMEAQRARDLDPLSAFFNEGLGDLLAFARRYDDAIEQYRKTLEIDSTYALADYFCGWAYTHKGMYREALAAFRKAYRLWQLSESEEEESADIGWVYALSGRRPEAVAIKNRLLQGWKRGRAAASDLALMYIALGEKDSAFIWLERARERKEAAVLWLKVAPEFDSLRSDPRFEALVRRVGIPA